MARKFDSLDVVKMRATLTRPYWRKCLQLCIAKGNTDKLMAWRYGLQAGLAEVAKKGINSDELDMWVIKRIRDVEKAMRIVLRLRHKNPLDNPKASQREDYVRKALEAKRKRDREFEQLLMRSNF